jgi:hypothetical protein
MRQVSVDAEGIGERQIDESEGEAVYCQARTRVYLVASPGPARIRRVLKVYSIKPEGYRTPYHAV